MFNKLNWNNGSVAVVMWGPFQTECMCGHAKCVMDGTIKNWMKSNFYLYFFASVNGIFCAVVSVLSFFSYFFFSICPSLHTNRLSQQMTILKCLSGA